MTNASSKSILIVAFVLLIAVGSHSQDRVATVAFFKSDPTGAKKDFLGYFAEQANADRTSKGYIFLYFRNRKSAVQELCWMRSYLRTLKTRDVELRLGFIIDTFVPGDNGVEKGLIELYLEPPDVEAPKGISSLKTLVCKP